MRLLFLVTIVVISIAGCAMPASQSSRGMSANDSRIVLENRTGNVDGHKTPFAREYMVAPGNHIVGVCNPGLCEKYQYIEFDAKAGYTYTVYGEKRIISVLNQSSGQVYTLGFDLRDGPPVVLSLEPSVVAQPAPVHELQVERPDTAREASVAPSPPAQSDVWLGASTSAARSSAAGYAHEPNGFKGIHWGDPIPSWLRPSCAVVGENTVCNPERENPSVTMGGRKIVLDSLVYNFWHNRFDSVSMHGPKLDLEFAFLERFGPATASDIFANGTMRSYDWEGPRANIHFYEGGAPGSVDESRAQVEVQSVKMFNEWAQSREKKVRRSDL